MRPEEIESTIFSLMFCRSDASVYNKRSVNKVFENKHLDMFKIVPPCIGSIINLECAMRIMSIEYTDDGKIVFWVKEMEG